MRTCSLLNASVLWATVEMAPVKRRFGLLLQDGNTVGGNLAAAALRHLPAWVCGWRCVLATMTEGNKCFRMASGIPVTHLESVGLVSALGFLPLVKELWDLLLCSHF